MVFPFHTACVILEFAPSTVFFLQSSVDDANPTQKSYISPDKIIYKSLFRRHLIDRYEISIYFFL